MEKEEGNMKESATKTILLVMIAIMSVLIVAQIAKAAGIATTKHDLSTTGPNATLKGGTDICVYCHTPHAATSTAVPLWNRALVTTGFTTYSSNTLNASITSGQVGGVSAACLSCHDGTVGVDAYATHGTVAAGTEAKKISGASLLTQNLSNDHPISFTYDATLASTDGGLVAPSNASWVVIAAGGVSGIPLFAGKMECASCHSVHDNSNVPFLRVSNSGSALCLKCHIK
jgi:predicted CXXCH cytochrome family protein